jgi:enoyl-CoA hydratase
MQYEQISYEVVGTVARLYHNRPDKGNAQSTQLLAEMDDALAIAKADDNVRVLILGANGKHFSAGHDLVDGYAKRGKFAPEEHWVWVQGACIAAGFMVANSCDLLVAADDAHFSDPVLHSMGAASVEALVHPWVLGLRKAKELLFTGGRITAQEAKEWGMANHVVPRAELEEFTLALAQRIAAAPPYGVKMLKRSLNRVADIQGYTSSLNAHFDTHIVSQSSREFLEIIERGVDKSVQHAKAQVSS